MGQLNDNMREVSRNLLSLHVKQVMDKYMQGSENRKKVKQLSDEEKENLKNLYYELEDQVNSFVQQAFNKAEDDEEGENETNHTHRTTLRDVVQKRRNKK